MQKLQTTSFAVQLLLFPDEELLSPRAREFWEHRREEWSKDFAALLEAERASIRAGMLEAVAEIRRIATKRENGRKGLSGKKNLGKLAA